jgi:hypothetical protein
MRIGDRSAFLQRAGNAVSNFAAILPPGNADLANRPPATVAVRLHQPTDCGGNVTWRTG